MDALKMMSAPQCGRWRTRAARDRARKYNRLFRAGVYEGRLRERGSWWWTCPTGPYSVPLDSCRVPPLFVGSSEPWYINFEPQPLEQLADLESVSVASTSEASTPMSSTSTALATDDEREHLGTGQQPLAAAQEPPLASAQVQELLEAAQEQPLETEHQQEPSTRTQEQNLEQEQVREQEADGSLLRGPRRTRESVIPLRVFLAILASLPRLQVGV